MWLVPTGVITSCSSTDNLIIGPITALGQHTTPTVDDGGDPLSNKPR